MSSKNLKQKLWLEKSALPKLGKGSDSVSVEQNFLRG